MPRVFLTLVTWISSVFAGCCDKPPPKALPSAEVSPSTVGASSLLASLSWELRDARTKKAVAGGVYTLTDAAGIPYAYGPQAKGTRYDGQRKPKPGDRLFVFVLGYDLAEVVVGDQSLLVVELSPAAIESTLGPVTPEVEGRKMKAEVRYGLFLSGQKRPVIDVSAPLGNLTKPVTFFMPRGMRARTFVEHEDKKVFVWPVFANVEPGATQPVVVERFRQVRLVPDEKSADAGLISWRCLLTPDYSITPDSDPRRLDSLTWWFVSGAPRAYTDPSGIGLRAEHVPDIRYHCFSFAGNRASHRIIQPTETTVTVNLQSPLKAISGRPLVNGEPVPDGTILASGRLDIGALSWIFSHRQGRRYFSYEVPAESSASWSRVCIAATDTLTLFSPSFGIAYSEWRSGEVPRGVSEPGTIVLDPPKGATVSGEAWAWPAWRGRGGVLGGRSSLPMFRWKEQASGLQMTGLPFGHYAVKLELTVTLPGREPVRVRRTESMTVSASVPKPRLRIELRE